MCVTAYVCTYSISHLMPYKRMGCISWEMVTHLASTYVDTNVWEHLWIWKRVIGMISWIVLSSFPIDRIIPAYMSHFRLAPLGGWPRMLAIVGSITPSHDRYACAELSNYTQLVHKYCTSICLRYSSFIARLLCYVMLGKYQLCFLVWASHKIYLSWMLVHT